MVFVILEGIVKKILFQEVIANEGEAKLWKLS